jgi:Integrase core domain
MYDLLLSGEDRSLSLRLHNVNGKPVHGNLIMAAILASLEMKKLNRELRHWEKLYNTVRPHQALGYLTPPPVPQAQLISTEGMKVSPIYWTSTHLRFTQLQQTGGFAYAQPPARCILNHFHSLELFLTHRHHP